MYTYRGIIGVGKIVGFPPGAGPGRNGGGGGSRDATEIGACCFRIEFGLGIRLLDIKTINWKRGNFYLHTLHMVVVVVVDYMMMYQVNLMQKQIVVQNLMVVQNLIVVRNSVVVQNSIVVRN
jgi:hypothetical protein